MGRNGSQPRADNTDSKGVPPKSNAALQGAAMAFGKPPVKPKPTSIAAGQNAALAAATRAEKDSSSPSRTLPAQHTGTIADEELMYDYTGGRNGRGESSRAGPGGLEPSTVRSRPNESAREGRPNTLQPPPQQEWSQSHIAANLAASRSASASPNRKTNAPQDRRAFYEREPQQAMGSQRSSGGSNDGSMSVPAGATDSASIPSTSSLIKTFERLSPGQPSKSHTTSLEKAPRPASPESKTASMSLAAGSPNPRTNLTKNSSARPPLNPGPKSTLGNPVLNPPSPQPAPFLSAPLKSPPGQNIKPVRSTTELYSSSSKGKVALPSPALSPPRPKPKPAEAGSQVIESKAKPKPRLESPAMSPLSPEIKAQNEQQAKAAPMPPPARRTTSKTLDMLSSLPMKDTEKDSDTSSEDSFVSASDVLPSPEAGSSSTTTKPIPITPSLRSRPPSPSSRKPAVQGHKSTPSSTTNAMSDALVASALASSRGASPRAGTSPHGSPMRSPAPAPPPPRRTATHLFHGHHHPHFMPHSSRPSSSPPKAVHNHHTGPKQGMRTTMRKARGSSEDEDAHMPKRGRKNLMKKHPNKHHEGDRKRWRDVVSERERKRYEGLWASNKGLYTTPVVGPPTSSNNQDPSGHNQPARQDPSGHNQPPRQDPSDCVSSLVVRDIWSRSRLAPDVLCDIWELVDRGGTGMLGREEFVVGTWLVDQRLKGRKLPQRVGESVWASVEGLGGVKLRDHVGARAKRKGEKKMGAQGTGGSGQGHGVREG